MKGAEAERTGAALTIVMATQTNPTLAANTTLCESFSELEPKKGRNRGMKPRAQGSAQAASIYPPVSALGPGWKRRAPFAGHHLSLGADQGAPTYPVLPSAERDVKCAHGLYMQVGWVTRSREVQTVDTEGVSALLNTYYVGPRGPLSNGRPYLACSLWARWIPRAHPSIGS